MTERLYYKDSFLYDFVAALEDVRALPDGRKAIILDRTAFYPTSGGQVFDTGWMELEPLEGERPVLLPKVHVSEVIDDEESGDILHVVEELPAQLPQTVRVRGFIDVERRRDHMQQHSGQHVLSAAFVELFTAPTVSFHMGDESCTIDLDTASLSSAQIRQAEARANQVVWEDRPVSMHEATPDQARALGVRKIPEAEREKLRLIEVKGVDLCACGGTHVRSTGQIGNIQIRKTEKVKQGIRVEFVCGRRALEHARRDFETLTEAAAAFSSHVWDVPAQTSKLIEASKQGAKAQHKLLEEIAVLTAKDILATTPAESGTRVIQRVFEDRDLAFVKLVASKLTVGEQGVIALLGAAQGSPALVFAQSPKGPADVGSILKKIMTDAGGRGGGNRDMAQGGVPDASKLADLIAQAAESLRAAQAQ